MVKEMYKIILLMSQTLYQITKSSLIQHTTHCTYHGMEEFHILSEVLCEGARSDQAGGGCAPSYGREFFKN